MPSDQDDKSFLQRWSSRKVEALAGDDVAAVEPVEDEGPPPAESVEPPAELPDVETLDADSDYTGFLGDSVPEDVAKLALRKLWRSDPVLANLDGLNDYDDDFSAGGMVSEVVKTAYRVGKGLLTDEEFAAENGLPAAGDAPEIDEENETAALESGEDVPSDTTQDDGTEGENLASGFHDVELKKPQ